MIFLMVVGGVAVVFVAGLFFYFGSVMLTEGDAQGCGCGCVSLVVAEAILAAGCAFLFGG